jgi:hypothetical protein
MSRSTRLETRLAVGLAIGLALAPCAAGAADPAAPAPKSAAKTSADKPSPRSAKDAAAKRGEAKTKGARKGGRSRTAKQKAPEAPTGEHAIADNVQLVPFPSHADAARRALAQNRRDQLNDAEKAARAPKQDDRWQSVLFELRSLDARGDVEACFWRVLAYYRLGEVGRARTIRQLCAFGQKEEASLDAEEALSGSFQPAAVMPEMVAAGERPPAPVANPAPYSGASPARVER